MSEEFKFGSLLVLCVTGFLITAAFIVPGYQVIQSCLQDNNSPDKQILCERVIQQQFPLKTEYPNDEKSAR